MAVAGRGLVQTDTGIKGPLAEQAAGTGHLSKTSLRGPSKSICVHRTVPLPGRSSVDGDCSFSGASACLLGYGSPIMKSRLLSLTSPPSARASNTLVSRLQQHGPRLRRPHDFFEGPGWRCPCGFEMPPNEASTRTGDHHPQIVACARGLYLQLPVLPGDLASDYAVRRGPRRLRLCRPNLLEVRPC